jgi:DNA-directed RNA polymerase specialized sigma24 family protein
VLDQIIEVEERRAQESELEAEERRRIKRGRKLPSAVVLAQLGLSHSKIAELTGVSRQAVRQQVARARDDVHHHCFK